MQGYGEGGTKRLKSLSMDNPGGFGVGIAYVGGINLTVKSVSARDHWQEG